MDGDFQPIGQRARSKQQKAARQAAILRSARSLAEDVGYDGVTMAELGRRAGVAKGTLYLYFRTKEEVFLRLYSDLLEDVVEAVCAYQVSDIDALGEVFTRAALVDPLFLPLTARLGPGLEAHVSEAVFLDVKRREWALCEVLAGHVAKMLDMELQRVRALMPSFLIVLRGAAQMRSGGGLRLADYPKEIEDYLNRSRFETVFPRTLAAVLRGG